MAGLSVLRILALLQLSLSGLVFASDLSGENGGIAVRREAPGGSRQPACKGCKDAAKGKIITLADLSTECMEKQLLYTDAQLKDRCVFYTSVPTLEEDGREYRDRARLGGQSTHLGLALISTQWACGSNKLTAWNLFPGKNDVALGQDSPTACNYYDVDGPGSWLYFLKQSGQQLKYFGNVSRAMARHCGGVVYVVTMRPTALKKYQNIWGTIEYPELLRRHKAGGHGAPTRLLAVDAKARHIQYEIHWDTREVKHRVKRGDAAYLPVEDAEGRDVCNAASVDYEPPDENWFA